MTVVSDQPITKPSEDRFGRSGFAARIARVLSSLEDTNSIVISVNGPWGEGKTSILNMIDEELRGTENTLVIKFNPWRFPDEERLLANFFKTLAERLRVDLERVSEKIGEGFKDFIKCLGVFQIAGVSAGGANDLVEAIFPKVDIEETKRRISAALLDSPKKIVVFMDDIDRLNQTEIQAVFRLVKLTADFPNTCYVLAFDDAIVVSALAEQFGGPEAGRSFLEKIVQVPLPVPPASDRVLRQMAFEGVESALRLAEVELTQEEERLFVTVFDKSFKRMLSSPRAVKRYTNMLNFALPILKDEANMLDLIVIEGVRAFFPRLYRAIRTESDVFLRDSLESRMSFTKQEGKERFDEVVKAALAGLTKIESESALFALRVLFPEVREYGLTLGGHHEFSDYERQEAKKRIGTSDYFRRYFNYGIPPHDVSDKDVISFVAALAESDDEWIMDSLGELSAGNRADVVIQKLRVYHEKTSSRQACKLALALGRRSDLIPESHPIDNFFGLGVLRQAAHLIRLLLDRIDDSNERDRTARNVAQDIDALPFGYEFFYAVRKYRKAEGSEEFVSVVSDECEQEVGRIFAEKLARAAQSQPIEDSYPRWQKNFYIHWRYYDQESLQQYAQRRLQQSKDVNKFLNAILGLSSDEKPGSFHIQDPDAEYRFLSEIIDPDEMMRFIRRCYPEPEIPNVARAVRWFVGKYNQEGSGHSTE